MRKIVLLLLLIFPLHELFSKVQDELDWSAFSSIPVMHEGRIKPLDTVARNALLIIHGKQSLDSMTAIEWLANTLFAADTLIDQKFIRIDHPDILGLIAKTSYDGKYYSYRDIQPHLAEIDRLGMEALKKESAVRSPFEKIVVQFRYQVLLDWFLSNTIQVADGFDLQQELSIYQEVLNQRGSPLESFKERYLFLSRAAHFLMIPSGTTWSNMGQELLALGEGKPLSSVAKQWVNLSSAFRAKEVEKFNQTVCFLQNEMETYIDPFKQSQLSLETLFNQVQPFYWCTILYAIVFLLAVTSWIVWSKILRRYALGFLSLTFVIHTLGLAARIYIQGRPPVTTLYSSAVFVGWVAVLICLVLEWKQKNSLGALVAAIIGFLTQIVAHHLAQSGDTVEMMRAVLDSNFWLSTHVVVITTGYASMYVAGMLANVYIIRRALSKSWDEKETKRLALTAYGVTCFSMLMSFTGTVLGGIWADQSWGRFWGWDPKENGALLIVLWCAILLHLRLGRMVSDHGFLSFTALGTIITSFSWFGVNLLGIGLHSYGFTEGTFAWLIAFIVMQVLLVLIGYVAVRSELRSK